MNAEIKIAGRSIGYAHEPLIIAEIGINHEGSLARAKEMVDAAISAGAEMIKHQTHVVEDEMSSEARSVIPGNADVSIYDIMQRCALNETEETELKNYVESQGAIFISTPFSRAAAERLERMDVAAYKIGSGECNNYPLIKHIAGFGKPVILSTGMNDIESVAKAVSIFRENNTPFALLHCTNIYPTPYELVRLGGIEQLQKEFPDAVVGLSDHTVDNYSCIGAVALGASILERHFTDSKDRPGPDIVCSMDPVELSELIKAAQALCLARGGSKTHIEQEQVTIDFAYASVVSICDIAEGDVLSADNVWVKRPGTGDFLAEDYEKLLGRTAACAIKKDQQIKKVDLLNNE